MNTLGSLQVALDLRKFAVYPWVATVYHQGIPGVALVRAIKIFCTL